MTIINGDYVDPSIANVLKLSNNVFTKARNAADTADIDMEKVNTSDRIEFASIPQVTADPSANNDLARKSWIDTQLGTKANTVSLSAAEKVYVNSIAGNDTTGDGTNEKPYATVNKALAMITDATQNKPYAIMLGANRQIETGDLLIKPYTFIVGEMQRATYFRINGGQLKPHADFGTMTGWCGFKNLYFGGSSVINFDLSAMAGNASLFIVEDCTLSGACTFKGRNAGAGDFVEMYGTMILGSLTMDTALFQINSTGIGGALSIANTLGFAGLSGTFLNCNFNSNVSIDATGGALTVYQSVSAYGTLANTLTTIGTLTIQTDSVSLPPLARQTISGGTTLSFTDDISNSKYTPATPANWATAPSRLQVAMDAVALASNTASAAKQGTLSSADWSTFNGKQNALGFTPENSANKGAAGGYCPLDAGAKVAAVFLPSYVDDALEFANLAAFPAVGAYAGVVYDTVTFAAIVKGVIGNSIALVFDGIADIDTVVNAWNAGNPANTVGFSGQAGTYVPAAGTATLIGGIDQVAETGKIYIAIDTSKAYRFSGSVYSEVSPAPVTSVNGKVNAVVLVTDDIAEAVTPTNKYFTDARAKAAAVADAIVDGVSDVAPSQNAVFDALAGKQATGNYITALTGEVTATGPGSAGATVANSAVMGKLLTGLSSAYGDVAATDTILQAFGKITGNYLSRLNRPTLISPITGSTTEYSTIQAALNAIPAATDAATARQVYSLFIPSGTYDEAPTYAANNRRLVIICLGTVTLGTMTGSSWGTGGTARDFTIANDGTATINSIRGGVMISSVGGVGEGFSTHQAYLTSKFRVSGNLVLSAAIGISSEFAFTGVEVFGNLDTSGYSGNCNVYLRNSRIRGTCGSAALRLQRAIDCQFDGLVTTAVLGLYRDSNFAAGFTTSSASGDFAFIGFYNCTITGTYTGPATSAKFDVATNYWFVANAATLSTATKTILADLGYYLSTDTTFAADSDTKVPSEKATKAYIASAIALIQGAATEEKYITMSAQNVIDQFLDLDYKALAGSVNVYPDGGPRQKLTTDYTLSYTGGVAGVTRVSLVALGDLAVKLIAGKKLVITYLRG